MAGKKTAASSGEGGGRQPINELNINPRDLTTAQVRELFLKGKEKYKKDYRVVQPNSEDKLISFGMLTIDDVLKWYGMAAAGTVYHIHGDEGSGKSTTAYTMVRNYQIATGMPAVYFDFERTSHSWYLRRIGLDEDLAYVEKPESMDEAVKKMIEFMRLGVKLFVVDSLPRMQKLINLTEIASGKAFGTTPGEHARTVAMFYRIVLPYLAKWNATLIVVNQTRSRIESGQDAKSAAAGYDTVTNLNYILPGGRDNRFAVSAMLELKAEKAWRPGKMPNDDEWILEPKALAGEEYLATEVRARSLKNKVTGTGFRGGTLWIRPGFGLDENISIRQYARKYKLITNKGAKWLVGDPESPIQIFENKDTAKNALIFNPDPELLKNLKKAVAEKIQANSGDFSIDVTDEEQRYLAGEQDKFTEDTPVGIPVDDDLEVA